jgi:hypothetical protein
MEWPGLKGATIPRLLAAGLLFCALLKHPYGYYVFLRWAVCAVATWTAVELYSSRTPLRAVSWLFAGFAMLFNPFVRVHLDRGTWAYLDVTLGVAFLAVDLVQRVTAKASRAVRLDVE